MNEPCTCEHPRFDHGFALNKRGCFALGGSCPCAGMPPAPAFNPDACPDCGRETCTGEDCYWPDEAGLR